MLADFYLVGMLAAEVVSVRNCIDLEIMQDFWLMT